MKYLACLLVLLFCTGCDQPFLTHRTVEVVLSQTHPWQTASHHELWHTLAYTDGNGAVQQLHLNAGTDRVAIQVRRDCLTIFCAYPLSSLFPMGGFVCPFDNEVVLLTQEQGTLASLLLDVYASYPKAIENLDSEYLRTTIGDASLLDGQTFVVNLLNGELDEAVLEKLPLVSVSLFDLPQGYWIAERLSQSSFYSHWSEPVQLEVEGGIQRWWNTQRGVCLTLYADSKQGSVITSLNKAPVW